MVYYIAHGKANGWSGIVCGNSESWWGTLSDVFEQYIVKNLAWGYVASGMDVEFIGAIF